MEKIVTLGTEAYNKAKTEALNSELMRKEISLSEFNVVNNTTIEIKMNIAEWFKNPNTWNLNQLNTVLMPNFDAQKLISANGKTVFSSGTINQ